MLQSDSSVWPELGVHTDMPGAHTRILKPSIPGPPRRAHLVNLANTWAHTWLGHIPTVLGARGTCQAGPKAPSPQGSHPILFPAPLASQTSSCPPLGFHQFLPGTQRAGPWGVKRQPVPEGSTGLAVKVPPLLWGPAVLASSAGAGPALPVDSCVTKKLSWGQSAYPNMIPILTLTDWVSLN